MSLATWINTVYIINEFLVRKYFEKYNFVKCMVTWHCDAHAQKADFWLAHWRRDGSKKKDGFHEKRSQEMANYPTSVEVHWFSYTPDTPPSIYLYTRCNTLWNVSGYPPRWVKQCTKHPITAHNIYRWQWNERSFSLKKRSNINGKYMNSMEVCQFSYIPDTPLSIFL